jgi:hypothetical protein
MGHCVLPFLCQYRHTLSDTHRTHAGVASLLFVSVIDFAVIAPGPVVTGPIKRLGRSARLRNSAKHF